MVLVLLHCCRGVCSPAEVFRDLHPQELKGGDSLPPVMTDVKRSMLCSDCLLDRPSFSVHLFCRAGICSSFAPRPSTAWREHMGGLKEVNEEVGVQEGSLKPLSTGHFVCLKRP